MEAAFRKWWQESYGLPPGSHAVMTHVAWAEYLLGAPPLLPADYTRCMGATPLCPQREQCARHCDIPDNVSVSWVRNLNIEGVEDCLHFIPFQR